MCRSIISNDTFDCYRGCSGTPVMSEGFQGSLGYDRRCTYMIDLWNKAPDEPRKLLFKVGEEYVDLSPYGDDVWFI